MGITARGAWECVKHHFRNLGTDIQTEPFTVRRRRRHVGRRVRQRHAALAGDHGSWPRSTTATSSSTPTPTRAELPRSAQRVFALAALELARLRPARSSARAAASSTARPRRSRSRPRRGGSSTSRPATPSGEEVIRKILTARVDLLYNGGIGTYVKAESEEHARGRRPHQRPRARERPRGARPRRSARAATSASPRRAGSSTGRRAAGSTPTPSTTPAASTPRTTR